MLKAAVLTLSVVGLLGMSVATAYGHREAFNISGIFGLLAMLRVSEADSFAISHSLRIIAGAVYVSAFVVLLANEFGAASAELVSVARWSFIATLALLVVGRIRAHVVEAHSENHHPKATSQ